MQEHHQTQPQLMLLSGKTRRKRERTLYSPWQLQVLENAFLKNQYVAGLEKQDLCNKLNLTETQVRVWFQNRRQRGKHEAQQQYPDKLTKEQHIELEKVFAESRYPNREQSEELCQTLKANKDQVKMWFQNRRQRFKREATLDILEAADSTVVVPEIVTPHQYRWKCNNEKLGLPGWNFSDPEMGRDHFSGCQPACNMAPNHIRNMAPNHIRNMAPNHIRNMAPNHIRNMAPNHIRNMAPNHIRNMAPNHIRNMAPNHIRNMAPNHIRNMAPNHIRNMAPNHIRNMAPNHIRNMAPNHIPQGNSYTPQGPSQSPYHYSFPRSGECHLNVHANSHHQTVQHYSSSNQYYNQYQPNFTPYDSNWIPEPASRNNSSFPYLTPWSPRYECPHGSASIPHPGPSAFQSNFIPRPGMNQKMESNGVQGNGLNNFQCPNPNVPIENGSNFTPALSENWVPSAQDQIACQRQPSIPVPPRTSPADVNQSGRTTSNTGELWLSCGRTCMPDKYNSFQKNVLPPQNQLESDSSKISNLRHTYPGSFVESTYSSSLFSLPSDNSAGTQGASPHFNLLSEQPSASPCNFSDSPLHSSKSSSSSDTDKSFIITTLANDLFEESMSVQENGQSQSFPPAENACFSKSSSAKNLFEQTVPNGWCKEIPLAENGNSNVQLNDASSNNPWCSHAKNTTLRDSHLDNLEIFELVFDSFGNADSRPISNRTGGAVASSSGSYMNTNTLEHSALNVPSKDCYGPSNKVTLPSCSNGFASVNSNFAECSTNLRSCNDIVQTFPDTIGNESVPLRHNLPHFQKEWDHFDLKRKG